MRRSPSSQKPRHRGHSSGRLRLTCLLCRIHALCNQPAIAHELLVLWEMLARLRREDQSP